MRQLIDLTPFGFTPTESVVYTTLLRLGPSTGYAVARAARLARANTYSALEGLVNRAAASRTAGGRPVRYRPTDPHSLLAQLATEQGEALDRLSKNLSEAARTVESATKEVGGSRAVANLIQQLVARSETRVQGLMTSELWRPTLPAWRRAADRAQITLQLSGELPSDAPAWLTSAPAEAVGLTALVIDETQTLVTTGSGDAITGLWSSHPLIVMLARRALQTFS